MTDEEAREHSDMDEVTLEALRWASLKEQRDEIIAEMADIAKYLDKAIEKSIKFEDGEEDVVVTIVRGTTDKFSDFLIATDYPHIWEKITRRVVDKTKYLDAVAKGTITPEMNVDFLHEIPKKSYPKITRYFKGNAIEASSE